MFRLTFLVEDKNLPKVLRDVAGSARDMDVRPVVNALPSSPKVRKLKAASGGDVQSMLMQKLPSGEAFGVDKVVDALKELGRPSRRPNAMGYIRAMARMANLVTVGRGAYMLNKPKEESND